MKRFHRVAGLALIATATVLLWRIIASPLKPRYVNLAAIPISFSNGITQEYSISVSNTSNTTLLCNFFNQFMCPWFTVVSEKNAVWGEQEILSPGGGSGLLLPHQAQSRVSAVPTDATKFKIGLHFTSLSWRGLVAWKILTSSSRKQIRNFAGFLMRMDFRSRSQTNWSEEYILPATINTDSVKGMKGVASTK